MTERRQMATIEHRLPAGENNARVRTDKQTNITVLRLPSGGGIISAVSVDSRETAGPTCGGWLYRPTLMAYVPRSHAVHAALCMQQALQLVSPPGE